MLAARFEDIKPTRKWPTPHVSVALVKRMYCCPARFFRVCPFLRATCVWDNSLEFMLPTITTLLWGVCVFYFFFYMCLFLYVCIHYIYIYIYIS